MRFSPIQTADWIVGLLLLAVIGLLLYRRRLLRELPVFSFYVLYHLGYGVIQFAFLLMKSDRWYNYLFWVREYVDIVVVLAVLYEIVSKVLAPYSALRKAGIALYLGTTAILGMVGAGMVFSYHSSVPGKITQLVVNAGRSIHFVELGVVFTLFVFCKIFALAWRHYVFGIAVGFGVKAGMQTVGHSLWLQNPSPDNMVAVLMMFSAYIVGLLVWTWFLATEEKTVEVRAGSSPQLERWNTALDHLLAR